MASIRAKSVCIFRHTNRILLSEGYDPVKDEQYLIPVGGGIDFGEISAQAAQREVAEELGAEAYDFRLLGVLENLFTFAGMAGHEIVFVYEAKFMDEAIYQLPELHGVESNGARLIARWFDQETLSSGALNVYPDGIGALLR